MAKKMYIGVDGVAREVSKSYIGVSSVARLVKYGYLGVSSVARQFFGFDNYLYNAGDNCSHVHGGFEALAYGGYDRGATATNVAKPTITENTSYIQFKGNTSAYGSVFTKNKINLTNYSKMYVVVRYYNRGGSCRMGFTTTKAHGYSGTTSDGTKTYRATEPAADATMPVTYSLDISKLTGNWYFACEIDGNNTIRVNQIYLV